MPHRPQGIGAAIVDGDGSPRPRGIADTFEVAVVAEVPQPLPGFPIETEHAFRRVGLRLEVRNIDAAGGHGRAAEPAANLGTPANGDLRAGELLDNAGFFPHVVASRAAPLGPIVGQELAAAYRQTD